MDALKYEGFVRGAFSLKSRNMINRGEDPAHLAEAGLWNLNDLKRVKVGTAYALEIYSAEIREALSGSDLYETVSVDLENLLDQAISAPSLSAISNIIDQVKVYQSQYIKFAWQ